jgi:hypothetical protein
MKKRSQYFVSYFYWTASEEGMGNMNISCSYPIKSIDDIRLIERNIVDNHILGKNKKVIILNWQKYETH